MFFSRSSMTSLLNQKTKSTLSSSSLSHSRRPGPLPWTLSSPIFQESSLSWLFSHLNHHSFSVSLVGSSSSPLLCNIECCRAQLLIILFSLFIFSLLISLTFRSHGSKNHRHANSCQIYIYSTYIFSKFQTWIANCLLNISTWMP
jgi:hypothetical protein